MPTRYPFCTFDVFSEVPFGGNPLAVFPDARGLDGVRMQAIAREFNLSETVFLLPPVSASSTRRARIFTPATELPFAGHPTLGAAFALATLGEIDLDGARTEVILEEGVGLVRVAIDVVDGRVVFCQLTAAMAPEVGPSPPGVDALAEVLSLRPDQIRQGEMGPEAVSCGVPFLFVALESPAAVAAARLSREAWQRHLAASWAPQVFLFAEGGELPGAELHARMFAPGLGVDEDPATGSAASGLAGYLGRRCGCVDGTRSWLVEQGVEMGRPSLLHVEAEIRSGEVVGARVGGSCVLVSEGVFRVPEAVSAAPTEEISAH